ncbi:uncharacterized protein RCO7_02529 [Rhynchosporium graminicola]|uniref:Uncharacterized protein n=1 Tax=Rhynchosporium graminicola TaxID=2792576 RepID=A0A1E1JUI3_9HELO|nr:uncharacterized protein RCO7_02529 [Rhynchosporium commune]
MSSRHGSKKPSGRHGEKSSGSSKRREVEGYASSYTLSGPSDARQNAEPQWDDQNETQSNVLGNVPGSESEAVPAPTFLFQVNQLPINEDLPPRIDSHGHSIPPMLRHEWGAQVAGRIHRWTSDGRIARASNCQWSNSQRANCDRSRQPITIFYARLEDMDRAQWPESHWFPLDFRHDHDRLVSRVDEGAREPYLAGVNANWIDHLGLSNFAPRYGEPAEGLSGNLATIFGMIAMSCSEDRFDSVMGRDPWRGNVWRGHSHRDGRTDDRGVVVRIYFDPDNSLGSTEESLDYLQ